MPAYQVYGCARDKAVRARGCRIIWSAKHIGRLERIRCDGGVVKLVGMSDDAGRLNAAHIVESSGYESRFWVGVGSVGCRSGSVIGVGGSIEGGPSGVLQLVFATRPLWFLNAISPRRHTEARKSKCAGFWMRGKEIRNSGLFCCR